MKLFKKFLPILFLLMFFAISASLGQPRPPQHGQDGNQETQDVPVGSGIAILLAMAGAYGAKKVYDARKKIRE